MEAGKYDITNLLTVNLQWVRAAQQAASNTPANTHTHTHISSGILLSRHLGGGKFSSTHTHASIRTYVQGHVL